MSQTASNYHYHKPHTTDLGSFPSYSPMRSRITRVRQTISGSLSRFCTKLRSNVPDDTVGTSTSSPPLLTEATRSAALLDATVNTSTSQPPLVTEATRTAALSRLMTCTAEVNLATRVAALIQTPGPMMRYMHGIQTALEPVDDRVQKYADSVLHEAKVAEGEAYRIVTSIFGEEADGEVTEATLASQARRGRRTLDDIDKEGQEVQHRVQGCYEKICGPVTTAEREQRRITIDDASYRLPLPGARPNKSESQTE